MIVSEERARARKMSYQPPNERKQRRRGKASAAAVAAALPSRALRVVMSLALAVSMVPGAAWASEGEPEAAPPTAQAPTFTRDLDDTQAATYAAGEEATPLEVEATAPDGGAIAYQWYSANSEQALKDAAKALEADAQDTLRAIEGARVLADETQPTFTPEAITPATTYYFVRATNALSNTQAFAFSKVATVVVKTPEVTAGVPETVELVAESDDSDPTVKEPAPDAVVSFTVSNKGRLAVGNGTVTVKDLDADGVLTYHEALYAMHAAYHAYGSNAYVTRTEDGKLAVQNFWNNNYQSNKFLFLNNGMPIVSISDPIQAGDKLYGAVLTDEFVSDLYTKFDRTAITVNGGQEITLTLTGTAASSLSANSVYEPVAGATIGRLRTDTNTYTALEGKVTDENGQVTLSFERNGVYIIGAHQAVEGQPLSQ